MIGSRNVNAWIGKTEREKKRIQSKATDYVRAKAKEVLMAAVKVSPQWSGNFAASWELNTKARGLPTGTKVTRFKVKPWQSLERPWADRRPDGPGPARYVNEQNNEIYPEIRWNSIIYLTNNSEAADMLEAGQVNLRPVNLVPAGGAVMAYLQTKYRFLK